MELAIHDVAAGSLSAGARWALCGGVAVAIACMGVIHLTATRTPRERDVMLLFGVAAGALAIGASNASVFVVVPLLVALLGALVAAELGHEEHRLREDG